MLVKAFKDAPRLKENIVFKKILACLTGILLVGTLTAATPRQPQVGAWEDGTQIYWLCDSPKGNVKVMIVSPKGERYTAQLSCALPTEKDI